MCCALSGGAAHVASSSRCISRFVSTNEEGWCFTEDGTTRATSDMGYGFGLELGAGSKTIHVDSTPRPTV